jgi:hypothetical protein
LKESLIILQKSLNKTTHINDTISRELCNYGRFVLRGTKYIWGEFMNNKLVELLAEYKEEKRCLEMGIEWLLEKDYAIGKLEKVNVIIADLEKILN